MRNHGQKLVLYLGRSIFSQVLLFEAHPAALLQIAAEQSAAACEIRGVVLRHFGPSSRFALQQDQQG
jgi:hypothetical protein